MWLGEGDYWPVHDGRLHSSAHHGVAEESGNTALGVRGVGVTEILLESLPIHGIMRLQEAKVWEEPVLH